MVNHSSIKYISSLLNNPDTITTGDHSSIALFRQTFPYFVPVRYLAAMESNKPVPFSARMLSEIQPYLGDWILFCDFLNAGNRERKLESIDRVLNKKEVEVSQPVGEQLIVEDTDKQAQPIVAEVVVEQPVVAEAAEQVTPLPITPVQKEEPVPAIQNELLTEETLEIVIEENENENMTEEAIEIVIDSEPVADDIADKKEPTPLILPVYTQDYFLRQGEKISEEIPDKIDDLAGKEDMGEEDKSLMVVMSFSEWLLHFKNNSQKQQEEKKDQRALKTMWQKEKLAAAMEEENEEIPENVFEMAVNSITKEDGLASETLADIYIKQEKYDQAIEMYRKLSLQNPQKSTYFARKIEEILKEK